MILKIKNMNNKLILSHGENNILNCISTNNTIEIKSSNFYNEVKSIDVYKSVIKTFKERGIGNIILSINKSTINKHAQEIIMMLSAAGVIRLWDSEFWIKTGDRCFPKLDAMKQYLLSIRK